MILQGLITFYNIGRGWGFITTAPTGKRYFFHISNFVRHQQPVLNGEVEFELGPGVDSTKPPQAINIRYRGEGSDAPRVGA